MTKLLISEVPFKLLDVIERTRLFTVIQYMSLQNLIMKKYFNSKLLTEHYNNDHIY